METNDLPKLEQVRSLLLIEFTTEKPGPNRKLFLEAVDIVERIINNRAKQGI